MNDIPIEYFRETVERNPTLRLCLCETSHICRENGKIVWDASNGAYIHLRFDHCVMEDEPVKRCDCIIFFQFSNDESSVFIFIVEVKDKWYSLTEIREKITTCIDRLSNEIRIQGANAVIIPVLYAERHISNARRTFGSYPIRVRGKSQLIKYLKHGERITEAIAIKRRGS